MGTSPSPHIYTPTFFSVVIIHYFFRLRSQVLDGLGLGPHGPPIPPPASFAVVPYPVRRRPPLGLEPPSHYVYVSSGPDDPNAPQEEKLKEQEAEVEKTPEKPQVCIIRWIRREEGGGFMKGHWAGSDFFLSGI